MDNMKFTVYSGTDCDRCEEVTAWLKDNEISYVSFNIRTNERAKDFLVGKGYRSIPQVYLNGFHVTGYKDYKKNISEALNKGG